MWHAAAIAPPPGLGAAAKPLHHRAAALPPGVGDTTSHPLVVAATPDPPGPSHHRRAVAGARRSRGHYSSLQEARSKTYMPPLSTGLCNPSVMCYVSCRFQSLFLRTHAHAGCSTECLNNGRPWTYVALQGDILEAASGEAAQQHTELDNMLAYLRPETSCWNLTTCSQITVCSVPDFWSLFPDFGGIFYCSGFLAPSIPKYNRGIGNCYPGN